MTGSLKNESVFPMAGHTVEKATPRTYPHTLADLMFLFGIVLIFE